MSCQLQGRPDGLFPGTEDGPSPGDGERSDDLQAMAGLGLGPARRESRRGTRLVGDHADQAARLKAPAQLDAPAPGLARGLPHGGGSSVLYRVGGQLGGDDDGIFGQRVQMPLAQRGDGERAGGPGGLRHGRQPDAAAPPCGGRR